MQRTVITRFRRFAPSQRQIPAVQDRHRNSRSALGWHRSPAKTNAANFLRIRFPGHSIGQMRDSAGMRRRRSPGKTGDREIETAPEKMDRTAFATEAGAKRFQDAIGLEEDAPETIDPRRIVASMGFVLVKSDRVCDLVRQKIDFHRELELVECLHHRAVESRRLIGRRAAARGVAPSLFTIRSSWLMKSKRISNVKSVRNWGGRQAARSEVKRDVPGMIHPWA